MIQPITFTKAWLEGIRAKAGYEKINPQLAEKMIHALSLVEQLSVSGLPFIFKGGTSLILLIEIPGRFSIDIDIITTASREAIETALKLICKGVPFSRYRLNEKRSFQKGIPKAHYELYYTSNVSEKEDHILLDILLDEHGYPELLEKPIDVDWIKANGKPVLVRIPTHESITGDKLTAFAPNTTGILYKRGKDLDIVKQLSDLGRLYHHVRDISTIRKAFDNTVTREIAYRGHTCTREDVLDDIIQTGLLIARKDRNKQDPDVSNFAEIKRGLQQFTSYVINRPFRIEDAIIASSKAALMAAKIKIGDDSPLPIYPEGASKAEFLINHPDCVYLNKLQGEALFYWRKTYELLGWHGEKAVSKLHKSSPGAGQ